MEGSHNGITDFDCVMTLTSFAEEYGIPNAFVISYGGNIQPPYDELAESLGKLKEIKWSVLGDASTPLPEDRLGWTQQVIDVAQSHPNITGGMVDDFFSAERLEKYPPVVLQEMKQKLNGQNPSLDFWSVLYEFQLKEDISAHLECFDGISFWIWYQEAIDSMKDHVEEFLSCTQGKRRMLGIYLWDYAESKKLELERFKKQLDYYVELLKKGQIEGIIFCSGCIGDAKIETTKYLREYLTRHHNMEI